MSYLLNVRRKIDGTYLVYSPSGSISTPYIVLFDDTANNVSSAIGVLQSFARKAHIINLLFKIFINSINY